MTNVVPRGAIENLETSVEDLITAGIAERYDTVPTNFFAGGVYARLIRIPKDTTLVGEIHKHEQINVVLKGKIRVTTEEGTKVLEAGEIFVSPAGVKRAGYTLEDTEWVVFHGTTSTNEADIRSEFIAPDYDSLDKHLEDKTNELDCNRSTGCKHRVSNYTNKENTG